MKPFPAFVQKEFHHIFRDRLTMLILLLMPVVLIILFGFALTTEVNNIRMAVHAPSNDELTRRITERFEANRYFTVLGAVDSPQEIERLFRQNRVDLAMIFEENFQSNLTHTGRASVQLVIDGSEPNTASIIYFHASSLLAQVGRQLAPNTAGPGAYTIVPNIKMLYNPLMKSAYNFVPGVMGLILMLICAMMTSFSIVREKERGTMEVLLVSPMRPVYILLAKVIPYFCISTVNVATILLLAVFVLKVPVAGSIVWIGILSLIYIFVALSLGILVSSLVSTQVAAMLGSGMGLMMPTMVLSGMVFPIENMPVILQWVSHIIPARWYISAIKKLMIQGLPAVYALKEFAVLTLMGVVLISVSLKLFKHRLE